MRNEILQNKNEALSRSLDLLTKDQERLKKEMKGLLPNKKKDFNQDSTMDTSRLSGEDLGSKDQNIKGVLKQFKENLEQMNVKCSQLESQKKSMEEEISSRDELIQQLRSENEDLEMNANKLRNSSNLNVLAVDEMKNQLEKEKMLRMLDQEGVEQIRAKLESKDKEIEKLLERVNELNIKENDLTKTIDQMGKEMEKKLMDIFIRMNIQLEERAKTIIRLKEEILTLKENKVFIMNSMTETEKEKEIYLQQLNMGVHDNTKLWFGSQLFDSGKKFTRKNTSKKNSKILKEGQNSSLFGNSLPMDNTQMEGYTEMESILKTKLDILEDEKESLLDMISKKEDVINSLKKKYTESKVLIEENLEIISKKNNESQIQKNLLNPQVCRRIREKSKFFSKLLKISYGACIDLFLKMEKSHLIKLEKKLNNCIQVNRELNDLIFSN
jgi:hypothetical protein